MPTPREIVERALERRVDDILDEPTIAEAAELVVSALREAGMLVEWRKIEDAPKDGTTVLIYDSWVVTAYWRDVADLGRFETGPAWQIYPSEDDCFYAIAATAPTHFMPLPPPPKEG